MSALSQPLSEVLEVPTGFRPDVVVVDEFEHEYTIVYINDDGTMAVRACGLGTTKWRVNCKDYKLKPAKTTDRKHSWDPPEQWAAPKRTPWSFRVPRASKQ